MRFLDRHLSILAALCILAMSGVAVAQPGQTRPSQPQPPPQPYPRQPPPQQYPGYGQPQQLNLHLLTPEERELVLRGEISTGAHVGGGLVGTFFGLGLGHAVQGRYGDRGWIFTVGEVGGFVLLMSGIANCVDDLYYDDCNDGMIVGGVVALSVFRIWELIDVWAGPASYNQRVRAARAKAYGSGGYYPGYSLYVSPAVGSDGGGVAGVTMRF